MDNMVIVTGGAGFIGSHLCKRMADEGYFVVSIDNYFTGSSCNHHKNSNIVYLIDSAKNIDENLRLEEYLEKYNLQYIFHLGEYSRVEQSFDDFDIVCEYNSALPSVCQFAKKYDAKLIYSGSSTKFADEGIISPYALTKAQNTEFLKHYAEWFGIDYAITYFYNVYGPGEIQSGQYSTVVAKFLNKTKNGEPLTITAPGTQERNFTHVYDIVNGLQVVAEKGYGDEYGIGNDTPYTIFELAFMMSDDIIVEQEKRGNRLSARVCNEKMKELGWSCKHNLSDYVDAELGRTNGLIFDAE